MISIRCLFKRPFLLCITLLTITFMGPSLGTGLAQSQTPGIKTDRAVYPEPPLPALPRAGGKFHDPVFGTEIMRATDETDGAAPGLGTFYSHWPTFNLDNTKVLIRKGVSGEAVIKDFDPVNFQIGSPRTLPNSLAGGGGPSWESSIWSNTDPDIIYTFSGYYFGGMKLYTFNVRTWSFKLIKDFSSLSGSSNDYLKQMYMSADNDVFCWLHQRAGANEGEPIAYVVYKRSTDTVLFHNPATVFKGGVNEVHVDKSGKWLHIVITTPQADGTGTRILNLQTGEYQSFTKAIDHTPGHGDMGTGTIIGFDNYFNSISIRQLDSVHSFESILDFRNQAGTTDWTNDFHGSMLADNEDWITIGTYDDPACLLPESGIFEDEIIQVATDGSQRFRRLLQTRSLINNFTETTGYWAMPKPTISKDGRFIAYNSNWENSGRYDLFIARIEPAPSIFQNPTASPTPTPTPNPTVTPTPVPTPSPSPTGSPLSEMFWVDDALPANATPGANGEQWKWVTSNPARYSGTVASQSDIAAGLHQHYFTGASATMSIGVGEILIAFVNIDPSNPPSQIMLQWKDTGGSWEHRAYWGANRIDFGMDGSEGRRFVGALPQPGVWVRLEVPASQVGLEGVTVNGMAFTQYDGRATWDSAGKATGRSPLSPSIFTLSGNGSGDAVALNAATLSSGKFNVTTLANFGADKLTRVMIFGSGLSNGVLNTNTSNDVTFGTNILPNIAESVVVEARTIDNRIYQLPVEFLGPSDQIYGLDQITVRLIEDLRGAGSVQLTSIIAGQRSNTVTINIL